MKARHPVVGIVLAGGKSSRMGGGDKCLLPLAGRPILAHVVERLKPQVAELIISANGDPARFSAFGLPVVEDRLGNHAGPLAGILAGLEWARINRPESRFVVTAASDTPFLPADLADRLWSAIGEGGPDLAVARSADGMHPVFGLWAVALAPDLEASLMSGDRKVSDLVRQHQAKEVMFPAMKIRSRIIDPFFNVNRPDELDAAEAFLRTSAV
ncbi:molybdenum cofactor guanylyltransferase MobA [Methyloceanibacter sp.]|uniref:molybdenum cofactor guanylyltransferase MobA n=1 Tax=Methyloceanibacter sp. TaxID=1965321 RepID=UPI003D6D6CFA